MIAILKATPAHATEVRAIAKTFGIKGCKLGTRTVHVGRQCDRITKETAHAFMDAVKAAGYHIDGENTSRELADKGLFDVVMVAKLA